VEHYGVSTRVAGLPTGRRALRFPFPGIIPDCGIHAGPVSAECGSQSRRLRAWPVGDLSVNRGLRILIWMRRFDLVIFDCDGVLVDSERLAVRTEAEILSGLGWPLKETDIVERFVGRSAAYMHREIERHLGRSVDWDAEFEPRYREVFERELVAVPGISEALDQITASVCVASSGSHDKMRFTLGKTGLLARFEGRIFSVDQVAHGKPAPDIFLFAADQMGAPPDRCAVVEDSVSGVTGGLAAGMAVFAFAGGVTSAELLSIEGAMVFDDMMELPAKLETQ
jgi:HAD superfamily hydrolase (TIGR01509 family)